MIYYRGEYVAGGTAILCTTDDGEPYADISVCLINYGIMPPKNQIVVPTYELSEEFYQQVKKTLIKREINEVKFGYAKGVLVELRDDWEEICHPM